VEITKHGRVVARLVPATGPHALRGRLSGVARSDADDEQLFGTGETWNTHGPAAVPDPTGDTQ
jgi:antitoxin (DNA-binding transcriptional repressor) of toxin-antitoxin stability system